MRRASDSMNSTIGAAEGRASGRPERFREPRDDRSDRRTTHGQCQRIDLSERKRWPICG